MSLLSGKISMLGAALLTLEQQTAGGRKETGLWQYDKYCEVFF